MAKRTEQNQDLGTSAPTSGGAADAVMQDQANPTSGKVDDKAYLVSFNRSVRLATFVLEDGTEVSDGDIVEYDVYKQLEGLTLDGYDLLNKEEK